MANKKISELTLFPSAQSTDEIPVNRLGMNGKLTVSSLSSARYIGESYGGGVIFHLWKDSAGVEHGLIVSIVNQGTLNSAYSNIDSTVSGATSTWDGLANTNLLKAQIGATSGAWKLCDDYSYGGFTDWYLPAMDELKLLESNRFNVNKTLSTIGGATQLVNQFYWSSTEINATGAFYLSGGLDYITNGSKSTNNLNVRAIRKF